MFEKSPSDSFDCNSNRPLRHRAKNAATSKTVKIPAQSAAYCIRCMG